MSPALKIGDYVYAPMFNETGTIVDRCEDRFTVLMHRSEEERKYDENSLVRCDRIIRISESCDIEKLRGKIGWIYPNSSMWSLVRIFGLIGTHVVSDRDIKLLPASRATEIESSGG